MDRKNIDKIAENADDRVLLAKAWDKIHAGYQKNVPSHTAFLSPREIQMVQYLFGNQPDLFSYGGYADAERKMYIYLPEYLGKDYLSGDNSPITCLRASFYRGETLTHRDILGSLIGCGITRESIGDILIGNNSVDFFISSDIAPYILENFQSAGRVSLKVTKVPMQEVFIPEQHFDEITDTVASIRLDSILSSGFRISRASANEYTLAGKVSIDGLICEKPDKFIPENSKISVRGLGKIKLSKIGHTTKKGRISVVIHRYQ